MKHGITHKNAVEIDSLHVYFQLSCKGCKNFDIWFANPIYFATHSLRSPALDNTPADASWRFRRETHDLAIPSYTYYTLWSYHHYVAGCVDLYLASESFQLECNQTYKNDVFYYLAQLLLDSFILDYSLFAFSAHTFVLLHFTCKLFLGDFRNEHAYCCVKSMSY